MERLDKRLANTGRWSRKEARELIRGGRVAVGGEVCRAPETKVGLDAAVAVDEALIGGGGPVYLMLNKPAGVVSSTDEPGKRTVLDLLGRRTRTWACSPLGGWTRTRRGCCCSPTMGLWPTGCSLPSATWIRCTMWRWTACWMRATRRRCAKG